MHRTLFYLVRILCLVILVMIESQLCAQSFAINYTSKDGLDNENVLTIAEDQDGYIYIGTASGVMLFDGVNFIPFSNTGTGSRPENVFVYDLLFDQQNNLWVRSELNGIYHWNRSEDHWTNFSPNAENATQLATVELTSIAAVDSFLYYSGRGIGLNKINIFDLTISNSIDRSPNTYSAIDTLGDELVLNSRQHLLLFDNGVRDTMAVSSQFTFVDSEIFEDQVFLTKYETGLFTMENDELISLGLEDITDPWRTRIIGVVERKLYVTARNSGLLKYDLDDRSWQLIESIPYDLNSLIKAKYNGGLIDSRGNIWVATSKGISCFNPALQGFQKIENREKITDYLLGVVYHDNTKNYISLYASSGAKVKIFDKKLQLIDSYNHVPDVSSVHAMFDLMKYKNELYAVSHQIFEINPQNGVAKAPSDKFLESLSNVRTANITNQGVFWCIHNGDQLSVYDMNTERILMEKRMPLLADNTEIKYSVSGINFDEKFAYITGRSVFFIISQADYAIEIYTITDGAPERITTHPQENNRISKVLPYDDKLYISSRKDGIIQTSWRSADSTFAVMNHLTTQQLYSPTDFNFDEQGDMWVATDNGLALLDDQLQVIKKYDSQNGLSNSKLSNGLSIVNNKIFLTGENGIVVGNSSLLKIQHQPKTVGISRFEVNKIDYSSDVNSLEFDHNHKNISIRLSMPIYGLNSDYKYRYRLTGNNDEWTTGPIDRTQLNYENLNPGLYTFEVQSIVGQNESAISKIDFEIKSPFWKTNFFILLIAALSILLLTLLYKYRVKKKVEKERINTLLSQLENTAIRSQLNPHFIFNSLNSIRSMILLDRKEDSVKYLEQFSDMVREVLQMSKEEQVTLAHEISFNKNYLEIEQLRFSDKFSFSFDIEEGLKTNRILVPSLIIQPFVENAIWHGLLHNKKDSTLRIDIRKKAEFLHIIIEDNGIGREKSKLLQKASIKPTKKNLGVSLSRKRISMLGENAGVKIIDKYDNENPTGTTVHIIIPLTYEG